jgi:hypothetical protein
MVSGAFAARSCLWEWAGRHDLSSRLGLRLAESARSSDSAVLDPRAPERWQA